MGRYATNPCASLMASQMPQESRVNTARCFLRITYDGQEAEVYWSSAIFLSQSSQVFPKTHSNCHQRH